MRADISYPDIDNCIKGGANMKKVMAAIMIISAVMLCSCAEIIEINERAFVRAMALDRSGDAVKVTLMVEDTGKGGGTVSGEGNTVAEALRTAELSLPDGSNLFIGHTQVFVAGRNVTPDRKLVRLLTAEYGLSPSCLVVSAFDGGDAVSEMSGDTEEKLKFSERQGRIKTVTLAEICRRDTGGFSAVPFADISGENVTFDTTSFISPTGGKTILNEKENSGYMLLSGYGKGMMLDVSTSCGYGALTVTDISSDIGFAKENGKMICRADIHADVKTEEKCGRSGKDIPRDETLILSAERSAEECCEALFDKTSAWQIICGGTEISGAEYSAVSVSISM